MKWCVPVMILGLVGAGCGSLTGPNIEYSAPAIEGRVVNADTGAPVHGAAVFIANLSQGDESKDFVPKKGGTRLVTPAMVHTDRQGEFKLTAQREFFLLFDLGGWGALDLTVKARDYETLVTNVAKMPRNTNGPASGPPLIVTGDLRLKPAK